MPPIDACSFFLHLYCIFLQSGRITSCEPTFLIMEIGNQLFLSKINIINILIKYINFIIDIYNFLDYITCIEKGSDKMKKVISRCPVCNNELTVARLNVIPVIP